MTLHPIYIKGDKGEKGDRGQQGVPGPRGIQGIQGFEGEKGEKGDTGKRGPIGLEGERGPKGERGAKGATGEKGEKGDPGKDADIAHYEKISRVIARDALSDHEKKDHLPDQEGNEFRFLTTNGKKPMWGMKITYSRIQPKNPQQGDIWLSI
jgi:hypothetical protein